VTAQDALLRPAHALDNGARGAPLHLAARMSRSSPTAAVPDAPSTTVDQSALQHLLGYHVAKARIPSRAAFYKYVGDPLELRHVEFTVLMLIKGNPGVTQKQLSQTLAVSAPNITNLLDRLVDRGLIERVRSEFDRRVQHIHFTAEGARLSQRAHELSQTCERELLKHLTEGERVILLELLDKVARHRRV
jgi:DNA-binding MarR family transcriptional regulator